MKNKHVHITEKQDSRIKRRAKETGLKQAEVIRRALDAYFAADFWDDIPKLVKQAVGVAASQLENGKDISHEQMRQEVNKRFLL